MVGRALTLVLASVLAVRTASADSAKLIEARAALAAVEYDKARALLVETLKQGTASPSELAEIYRLSASTATVLGDREVAEQYYRRWLALEPMASLPPSVAPKLREPFVAAQAYMAAHGRLAVTAQRNADRVVVVLEADPLVMAASVAVVGGTPIAFDASHRATLAVGATAPRIVVLDEFGNTLVALDDIPVALVTDVPSGSPSPSLVRHPLLWGILTVAAGGTTLAFGLAARSADDDLANILANSGAHTLADAEAAQDRRDRHALVTNIGFVATGVFAVTTTIMILTRPSAKSATVVPQVTRDGIGVAAVATW